MYENLDRIMRAVTFIEERLHEDLDPDSVAKAASFSRWHFQRVFQAVIGCTLKEYIRKRRLSEALKSLCETDQRVIDIAFDAGFESQEAFSRAFKKQFARTPASCRDAEQGEFAAMIKPPTTKNYVLRRLGEEKMTAKVIECKERYFIGLGTTFICILSEDKNNDVLIPKLWNTFIDSGLQVENQIKGAEYGLCQMLSKEEREHPDECHYTACVEVKDLSNVPDGFDSCTVPAGKYLIFTHYGSLDKLEVTMKNIYGQWIPQSNYTLREAPDIEVYDSRFNPNSDDSEFDICIPIE